MDERNRGRSFTDSRSDAFDVAAADVARSKNASD
jgi:hypothetical protein